MTGILPILPPSDVEGVKPSASKPVDLAPAFSLKSHIYPVHDTSLLPTRKPHIDEKTTTGNCPGHASSRPNGATTYLGRFQGYRPCCVLTDLDRSDVTHKLQRMVTALLVLRVPEKHDDTFFCAVHRATVDPDHDPRRKPNTKATFDLARMKRPRITDRCSHYCVWLR